MQKHIKTAQRISRLFGDLATLAELEFDNRIGKDVLINNQTCKLHIKPKLSNSIWEKKYLQNWTYVCSLTALQNNLNEAIDKLIDFLNSEEL